MKKIIQAAALTMCLSMVGGCANHLSPDYTKPQPITKQSSAQLPSVPLEHLSRLANDTAYMISKTYSSDELVINMNIRDEDVFGDRLKKSLEAGGFIVYADTEKTYQGVDLVYVLRPGPVSDGSNGCYLYVTMSNGFALCQAYQINPKEGFVIVPNSNNPVVPHSLKDAPDVNAMLQKWSIQPGSLEQQLGGWCKKSGYSLAWEVNKDFIMPVNAQFQGTFERAVQRIFAQMNENGNSIDANIYRGNRVLEVRQN